MGHAFWSNFLTWSAKRRREIFTHFEILTTTASSSKSVVVCLHMKTICAKQANVHFAYFVQHDQLGIITEHLTFSWQFNFNFYYFTLFTKRKQLKIT